MTIAKIIAPITGAKRDSGVLAAAFAAAKPFNAHVVALLVRPDPRLTVPAMGAPLSPEIMQNTINAAEELNEAVANAARATLARAASVANVAVIERPETGRTVTCSYREIDGLFADTVARAAHLCDLVVFGSLAATDGGDVNDCFVDVLTKTDRPVLLSTAAPANITGHVAIAWDGGAAACHAVTRAMPFLKRAQSITVLHTRENNNDDEMGYGLTGRASLHELRDYLGLHGIARKETTFERGSKSVGEALLDAALDHGADLLVMGGYSHSHLRESIFGGVTAHIRWHAELPVLMVH